MKLGERASIIIPTGGRVDALIETLESIERYAPGNEVIVIGDKNDDLTRRALRETFHYVKYFESDESSAVVKRNIGIARATNNILIFVDDDVVIESGWLKSLLWHYDDISVGGVGGRVKIHGLKGGSSAFKTGVIEEGFVVGNWDPPVNEILEVQHLIGCNMSFRRSLVMKVGGFDNFFRSCNFREETDLCLRIRQLGYRLIFDPNASLVHKALGRKSSGARWIYYYVRNTIYIYLKYQTEGGLSILRFLRLLIFPPKDYAALSGVRISITPSIPLIATGGLFAGFLGYFTRREHSARVSSTSPTRSEKQS